MTPTEHRNRRNGRNRRGHISEAVGKASNWYDAYSGFSSGKHNRRTVQAFARSLDENLLQLDHQYQTMTWQPSDYQPIEVFKPKHRIVHRTQVCDHVMEWAMVLPVEQWLMDTFWYRSPACVPRRGTHCFIRQEKAELRHCSQAEVYYAVQLDVHHYFMHISHPLMKQRIREKIKDPVLLHAIDTFISSYGQGLVLGVKLSQLLSGLYLAPFDRMALDCFGIACDPDKYRYWQKRYVNDTIETCRTEQQAQEISKGIAYLCAKFDRFVSQGLRHYSRFADNILIKHSDKVFLHLMVELSIMVLARDFYLQVNRSWNVRPTWMGIDICGHVFYHTHTAMRKRNKKALCRQVARLRKAGLDDEQIRRCCASRLGFAYHCDARNLLKTLNMERRLGSVVKNRRKKAPFEGMLADQKKSIDDLICHDGEDENAKTILLTGYKLDDSVIEKNPDGTPKRRLSIRYKVAQSVTMGQDGEPVFQWGSEHYSFTGSKVMIDQAENDLQPSDLPLVTVIREFENKFRKKFYKMT